MLRSQMRLSLVEESGQITILVLKLFIRDYPVHLFNNTSRFIVSFLISIGWEFCFKKIAATSFLICQLPSLWGTFMFLTVLLFRLLYLWSLLFYVLLDVKFLQGSILLLVPIWCLSLFCCDIHSYSIIESLFIFRCLLEASRYTKITLLRIQLSRLKRRILHEIRPCWSVYKVFYWRSFIDTFLFVFRFFPFTSCYISSCLICSYFLYLMYVTSKHLLIVHREWFVIVSQNRGHLYSWHVEFAFLPVFAFFCTTRWIWFWFLNGIHFGKFSRCCISICVSSLIGSRLLLFRNRRRLNIGWRIWVIRPILQIILGSCWYW